RHERFRWHIQGNAASGVSQNQGHLIPAQERRSNWNMQGFFLRVRLYQVTHPNEKGQEICLGQHVAPEMLFAHVRIQRCSVDHQLHKGVKPETKSKAEYSVSPRHSEVVGAHDKEHKQATLHESDNALKIVHSDYDPVELSRLRAWSGYEDDKPDQQAAGCRPFKCKLGQILETRKGFKSCAEYFVQDRNHEHILHGSAYPVGGEVRP